MLPQDTLPVADKVILPTTVPVTDGAFITALLIVGLVNVLLVKVCVAVTPAMLNPPTVTPSATFNT
jgi:hypothetical protein